MKDKKLQICDIIYIINLTFDKYAILCHIVFILQFWLSTISVSAHDVRIILCHNYDFISQFWLLKRFM